MKSISVFSFLLLFLLSGCIKDDIIFDTVDPEVRLIATVDSLAHGDEFLFEVMFTNNVGQMEEADFSWESSNSSILSVDQNGLVKANDLGKATITVQVENEGVTYTDEKEVIVGMNTVITSMDLSGTITPSSFYVLEGDFTLTKEGENLLITFADNYMADEGLPGLYVYLTNNPATIANALEIGPVQTFNGAHQYSIPGDLEINAYSHLLYFCKPFTVKVGDGKIE